MAGRRGGADWGVWWRAVKGEGRLWGLGGGDRSEEVRAEEMEHVRGRDERWSGVGGWLGGRKIMGCIKEN